MKLSAPDGYTIRYTTDGAKVKTSSSVYHEPIKLDKTTTLKYRAYSENGAAVGHEILRYYELNPLKVKLTGETSIPMDSLWETGHSWYIPFVDSMEVRITPLRKGKVRYVTADLPLNHQAKLYHKPFKIKEDVLVKAGLFVGDSLVGKLWIQHFRRGID